MSGKYILRQTLFVAPGVDGGSRISVRSGPVGALPFASGAGRGTNSDSTRDDRTNPSNGRSCPCLHKDRKRFVVENAPMRRLSSRADNAVGNCRSRTAGVHDRQGILGGYGRVPAGQQGQAAVLEDI